MFLFQDWRLKIREAEEALAGDRLDDAQQLLSQPDLAQYLPAKRLATELARRIAERACRRTRLGDTAAGWHDLDVARRLTGDSDPVLAARETLVEHALAEVENCLRADDAAGALVRLDRLQGHQVAGSQVRNLRQVAMRCQRAQKLCRLGRFAEAEVELTAAASLRPDLTVLDDRRKFCGRQEMQARQLRDSLQRALTDCAWSKALNLAEELLAMSPECRSAREARHRAWIAAAGGDDPHGAAVTMYWPLGKAEDRAAFSSGPQCEIETMTAQRQAGSRFLLWVDAVGGYLVCLADEIMLGQAVPQSGVDVPILADLSRRHARIRRTSDAYLLEPLAKVQINGREIREKAILSDGNEIQLGAGVRLKFRRPHPLSASARLDLVSRHRTQPPADGIILMAESCVLGPRPGDHVVCRDWREDVVLFRQGGELFCRASEPIEIDGQGCDGRGPITRRSRIVGSDFSLSLEEL